MKKRSTTLVIGVALALVTTPACASTATYSGTGWKIATFLGVKAISPTQQFTVTFASQTVKNRWAPKLTAAIAQLNATGVHIKIGGIETYPNTATCPVRGHVFVMEAYRPLGTAGYSRGLPCHDTENGAAWGGWVQMDSEYGAGTWKLADYLWKNLPAHEMLHAIGLNHANSDVNGNGVVENFECVKTSYGNSPLMCSPNGGYKTAANAGKLVGFDINGVKALLNNAKILGIK